MCNVCIYLCVFGDLLTCTLRYNGDAIIRITGQVDELRALLADSFSRPVAAPADIASTGCRAPGASCPPTVEAGGNGGGGGLVLNALGGSVVFESAECEATDLCKLANDLAALLTKFNVD